MLGSPRSSGFVLTFGFPGLKIFLLVSVPTTKFIDRVGSQFWDNSSQLCLNMNQNPGAVRLSIQPRIKAVQVRSYICVSFPLLKPDELRGL